MRSRFNSLKHGLSANSIVLSDEDPHELDKLLEEQCEEFGPEGALENALVIEMTRALWRLRRALRIEVKCFENRNMHTEDLIANVNVSQETVDKEKIPFDMVLKYRADAERAYYRALAILWQARDRRVSASTLMLDAPSHSGDARRARTEEDENGPNPPRSEITE